MNLSVVNLINDYHVFDKDFWLNYKTLEKLHPDFESIKMSLLKTKRVDKKYIENLESFELEKQLLAEEWQIKSDEAKTAGINTHEYIKNLLKVDPKGCTTFQLPTDKYTVSSDLLNASSGIFIEQRLEIPLDDEYTLVGVPDCFVIHDGQIDIKDWKVLESAPKFKSMYEVSKKQNKKMKYPLALDDVNGVHYQIQLSIYMWMLLQIRPDLKPGQLEIVWIQHDKIKKVYPVEYLENKINKFIAWHLKSLHLKNKMHECREIKY